MATKINENTLDKMLARRKNKGYADGDRELLMCLLDAYEGENLVYALTYEGYATETVARKFVNSR